jgi:hypothetical protein
MFNWSGVLTPTVVLISVAPFVVGEYLSYIRRVEQASLAFCRTILSPFLIKRQQWPAATLIICFSCAIPTRPYHLGLPGAPLHGVTRTARI